MNKAKVLNQKKKNFLKLSSIPH